MIVKLLNGDLLSIVRPIDYSHEEDDEDDGDVIKHIKKKIEEFNQNEYRVDCQILIENDKENDKEKDEKDEKEFDYLLVMDFQLEYEDAYGAAIDSRGYYKNIGVYHLSFTRMLPTAKKADVIWFAHNEVDNTFAYLPEYTYSDPKVTAYPYASLSHLILDLPHYIVVPRSDVSLTRLDQKWNSGSYLWKDWKERYNI